MRACILCLALLAATVTAAQVVPHDRLSEQWWKDRHEQCVRLTQTARVDVAFLGDSITQGWEGPGSEVWDQEVAPLKAANFGFSGDRTDNVLWRVQNGELVGLHPKVIVLMIGTNDIGQNRTPEDAAAGVRAIVSYLREKSPRSKILLLAIFPRGSEPNDPLRLGVERATSLIKGCADGRYVRFLDIGPTFLHDDGRLSPFLFPDELHPNELGYQLWAKAVLPVINDLMGR